MLLLWLCQTLKSFLMTFDAIINSFSLLSSMLVCVCAQGDNTPTDCCEKDQIKHTRNKFKSVFGCCCCCCFLVFCSDSSNYARVNWVFCESILMGECAMLALIIGTMYVYRYSQSVWFDLRWENEGMGKCIKTVFTQIELAIEQHACTAYQWDQASARHQKKTTFFFFFRISNNFECLNVFCLVLLVFFSWF